MKGYSEKNFGFEPVELGIGADSKVEFMDDPEAESDIRIVRKNYSRMTREINKRLNDDNKSEVVTEKIIREYIKDTKRASELEKTNPELFTFTPVGLTGVDKIIFHVVPQGEIIVHEQDIIKVIGQDFIAGKNGSALKNPHEDFENRPGWENEVGEDSRDIISVADSVFAPKCFKNIGDSLGLEFAHYPMNVIYRKVGGTVHGYITDLGGDLRITYGQIIRDHLKAF